MWENQGPQSHGQRSLVSSVTKGQYGVLQRNVLIAPRYPGLSLSNGYLQGLYGATQPAAYTVVAVGGHRRGGDWRRSLELQEWMGISKYLEGHF